MSINLLVISGIKSTFPCWRFILIHKIRTSYYELPLGGLIYFQNDDIQIVNVHAELERSRDAERFEACREMVSINDRACKSE